MIVEAEIGMCFWSGPGNVGRLQNLGVARSRPEGTSLPDTLVSAPKDFVGLLTSRTVTE